VVQIVVALQEAEVLVHAMHLDEEAAVGAQVSTANLLDAPRRYSD
jgi:hypothetical protein